MMPLRKHKTARIGMRVTPVYKAKLEEAAAAVGMSLSDWLVWVALRAAKRQPKDLPDHLTH